MIHEGEGVQVITNDSNDNKPGDFAIVRIKVGLFAVSPALMIDGWALAGFSYTTKTRDASDYVSLVYRFSAP